MILKLSLSDEVAARLDSARGLHSRQEFVTNALIAALEGSCVEKELRAEIDRLLRILTPVSLQPALEETQAVELTW